MFPLSGASILTLLITWLISVYSGKLISWEIKKCREAKLEEHRFMTPLRFMEVTISVISLLEVLAWGFFLYMMYNVNQKLPFNVVCGAIGLNFFLNFVMTCGIMRSKETYDTYLNEYSEKYQCTYRFIKFFMFFVSHKGFYMSFARFQRNRDCHSHFDFTYFDHGDDDGVSGFCFKFFFVVSILLLHGAVIAACVLNYFVNDLTQ